MKEETKVVTKLKNGVSILLYPNSECLSAAFGIFVGVGAAHESVRHKEQGIAHVIEHMMFKSSKKLSTDKINNMFSQLGAENNAYTDWDTTAYHARVPYQNLGKLIDLMTEMVRNPRFMQTELDTEKGAILAEIKRCEDDHASRTVDEARGNLLAKQSRWRGNGGIIGLAETVEKFKSGDLHHWYKRVYRGGNVALVVVGKFNVDDVLKQLTDKWHDLPSGKPSLFDLNPRYAGYNVIERETHQGHVCQTQIRHIDALSVQRAAQTVMAQIYGSGPSSRLWKELREKRGLCYACHGYTSWYGRTGNNVFFTYVGADADKLKKVNEIVDNVQIELAEKNVSMSELERAKNQIIGSNMIEHDELFRHLHSIGEWYLCTGVAPDIYREICDIQEVCVYDVLDAARNTFINANQWTTFCTPKDVDNIIPELKWITA